MIVKVYHNEPGVEYTVAFGNCSIHGPFVRIYSQNVKEPIVLYFTEEERCAMFDWLMCNIPNKFKQ